MMESSAKWDRIPSTSCASTALKYGSGRAASCSLDSLAVCVATSASLEFGTAESIAARLASGQPLGGEIERHLPGRDALGLAPFEDRLERAPDACQRLLDLGVAPAERLAADVVEDAARVDDEVGRVEDAALAEAIGVGSLAELVLAAPATIRQRRPAIVAAESVPPVAHGA